MAVAGVIQSLREHVGRVELETTTDTQLLKRFIAERDDAAFATLVRRHGAMVWGCCKRALHQEQDAEDAFQATFVVLVRKAASIRPPSMLGNWLYGVAHQISLKARAMNAKRMSREKHLHGPLGSAEAKQDPWQELQPVLDRELSLLPDKYRAIIVLCDLQGKTRKEAATLLALPEGTVAGRQARGRAMLAKRLARHGFAVSGATLAGLLAQGAASASVPTSVVAATVKSASLAGGLLSAKVAALAEGVVKAMFLSKLKTASTSVLLVLAVGTTTLSFWVLGHGEASPARENARVLATERAEPPADIVPDRKPEGETKEDKVRNRLIFGVVKEVDNKSILLTSVSSERDRSTSKKPAPDLRVLLNEKTEFLRETGDDVAPAKLADVTQGKFVYVHTEKQGDGLVAIVVVLELTQDPDVRPPGPKAVEEPKKGVKDDAPEQPLADKVKLTLLSVKPLELNPGFTPVPELKGKEPVWVTFRFKIDNRTGKALTVYSACFSAFDGLTMLYLDGAGKIVHKEAFTERCSPLAEAQPYILKSGATEGSIHCQLDKTKFAAARGFQMRGTLPGSDYKLPLESNVVQLDKETPPPADAGDWSRPVNGLRARLNLAERPKNNGTRWLVPYLELQSVKDVAGALKVRCDSTALSPLSPDDARSPHVKFELVSAAGKALRSGWTLPRSGPHASPGTVVLPYESSMRINMSCSNWGIPKDAAAMVATDSGAWVIQEQEKGAVYLRATISGAAVPADANLWHGKLETTLVPIDWKN